MDTTYYNLHVRRVKVSGGPDLLTFVPTPAPAPAGEVLDFDRCRRRLETKAAWKQLADLARQASESEPAPEAERDPERPRRLSHRERTANGLELLASLAVIAAGVAAVLAFLRLV